MGRFRLKSLRAGWGPIGTEVEVKPGERDVLHPLFVVLRDRRALLYSPIGREHLYVVASIEQIRDELTATLKALGPDSDVRLWIEKLRAACREYLDAADVVNRGEGMTGLEQETGLDLAGALAELREAFRILAEHVAAIYKLPVARELANDIRQADQRDAAERARPAGASTSTAGNGPGVSPAPDHRQP